MKILTILLLTASLALGTQAQAAEPTATNPKAARVIAEMFDGNPSGLLLKKRHEPIGGESASSEVVFRHDGKRYTVFYSPPWKNGEPGWLAFWVRPDGTAGPDLVETFSDFGYDGSVNSGVGPAKGEKLLHEPRAAGKEALGEEHRGHWQSRLDAAYDAALAFLDASRKKRG